MKATKRIAAIALLAALPAVASAQPGVDAQGGTWATIGIPDGTNPGVRYWNNASDDGASCNIGYFVYGNFGPCSNETPASMGSGLGWTDATYLAYDPEAVNAPTVHFFNAGKYNISYLGNVAGANPMRQFGYREIGSGIVNWLTAGTTTYVESSVGFEWVLQAWSPTGSADFTSNSDPRMFSVFANGTDGYSATEFFVGAEDNNCFEIGDGCARVSDRDYNDAFALVQVVPEPSTYMLMAVGLAGLFGVARRRKA